MAVLALGLVGLLSLFRNTIGGVATRTSVSVAAQAGGRYGMGGSVGGAPSGRPVAYRPAIPEPDSSSAEPDGSSAADSATAGFRFAIP
jgi:hypothetical protein